MMITIAVLITCHNRKDKTLACLEALYAQERLELDFNVEVFLVDDGSSDGTSEAIRIQFPEVNIIQGDGNLYWNRGMHLAWKTAVFNRNYDYFLWLNDDTIIFNTALQGIIGASNQKNNKAIIVGPTTSLNSLKCTYSGQKKIKNTVFQILEPNDKLQKCERFNGNFVLIPNAVFNFVGNLDHQFHHALGDYDYGLRATNLGVDSFVYKKFIGVCEINEANNYLLKKGYLSRLKFLYSPFGPTPSQFFRYNFRHFGFFWAVLIYLGVHLKILFHFNK
jgi:GT2 family glycosyltransferase